MGKISGYFIKTLDSLKLTILRFALVPAFLAAIAVSDSLLIEDVLDKSQTISRLIFACIFGAFLATAVEFSSERLQLSARLKWLLQGACVLLVALYYLYLTSPSNTGMIIGIRLLVICFALLAFTIWIPSLGKPQDFAANALIHFKSVFISALYSLVLTLGLLAIYFAVDLLLVKLENKIPLHITNIMGTFFFPIYYLSLLPRFNSAEQADMEKREKASAYPRFLEILVSYIALPLVAIFTAVLAIYLVKMLVTLKWPAGELGPMILGYSSVGLILLVLCGRLTNRFAILYRRFFPMALIPLVGLQLYSVFIRINAYGITESRYYLVLFGIYSIVCAIYLIAVRNLNPGKIALLAACFAILSILPPADAFTVSRNSQSARIFAIFERNHMLSGGKIVAASNVPVDDKIQITNIMGYFDRMGHNGSLGWLPKDYQYYRDFEKVFGFGMTYNRDYPGPDAGNYFNANVDQMLPMDVSGYETMIRAGIYSSETGILNKYDFKLDSKAYRLEISRTANGDLVFAVVNDSGTRLAEFSAMPFIKALQASGNTGNNGILPPEKLTYDVENSIFRVRVVFQNLSFRILPDGSISEISGDAIVLIGRK